jgi:hypothetical protein
MQNLLREYVRGVLLESVSTEGLAVFTGEGFFDPQAVEAVLVDIAKFEEELAEATSQSSLFSRLDAAKFAATKSVVGYISFGPPEHGQAWGAWEVTRSAGRGYGKILYAIGYALSPKGLIMPDRRSVSFSARAAWEKASKNHDSLPLDALPPENKTDTTEDDAEIHDEEDYPFLDRAYKAQGWEKGTVSRLIAAGKSLEGKLEKKFKGKAEQIVAKFHSAGTRLFMSNYSEGPEI